MTARRRPDEKVHGERFARRAWGVGPVVIRRVEESGVSSVRVLTCLRWLYGLTLLLAPGSLLDDLAGGRSDSRIRVFARVLGARQVAQAAVISTHSSRRWILGGAAIDAAHAGTMVGLAVFDRRHRALASANALGASGFALAGLREASRR